ncbi:hypothetical protein PQX77_019948 [Marasmius sp. AFHP31]|nr:hypothetical protein PQX77_019948 [Marasmius sp. AFHP31]
MHANKRRRIEELDDAEARYLQAIIPEVDVEIGLRQRLADTIEARIAWASLLQEALENDTSSSSAISFKDLALDALDAVESRTRILFPADANVPVITPTPPTTKSRPPPKEKPLTRSQKGKFLFLRSDDPIYILRCPTCLRHSFSTLQGLYNHSRISHHVEWGSHEECVKACAVLQQDFDQPLDLDAGIEVGSTSQIGGILPGVRSLFQMAVEGSNMEPNSAVDGEGDDDDAGLHLTRTLGWHSETPALAQFLGKEAIRKGIKVGNEEQDVNVDDLPENGPSLAPRRRWRMPYTHRSSMKHGSITEHTEEETSAAIFEESQLASSTTAVQPDLSSSRFHITCRITITDHSLFIPTDCRTSDHTHKWMISVESSAYSLDLTSVLTSMTISPLSDLTGMPAPHMFDALSTKDPPFIVVGTTAEHFLANVELKFNPSMTRPEGQTVVFEHWVGLDMVGSASPCKGEEQVVDVELDRDTVILPTKTGYSPITSKDHWDIVKTKPDSSVAFEADQEIKEKEGGKPACLEYYILIFDGIPNPESTSYQATLQSLLPRFPMTMKDIVKSSNARTGAVPRVPYRLVADVPALRLLIVGRRKAIEWGRARAIRDAYTEKANELSGTPAGDTLIPLTVGDAFGWLEDEGHFFREKVDAEASNKSKNTKGKAVEEDKWCRVCGLGLSLHGNPSASNTRTTMGSRPSPSPSASAGGIDDAASDTARTDGNVHQCSIVPKVLQPTNFPTIDIQKVLQQRLLRKAAAGSTSTESRDEPIPPTTSALAQVRDAGKLQRDRLIVSTADPKLIHFVLPHVSSLRLAIFNAPDQTSDGVRPQFPANQYGSSGPAMDATLAPYAYLALATKQFLRHLLTSALDISKRDREYGIMSLSQAKNPQGQDHYNNTPLPPVIFMHPGLAASGSRKKPTTGAGGRKKESTRVQNSMKVLTPIHVLGAINNAQAGGNALYACFARLGISTRTDVVEKSGSG